MGKSTRFPEIIPLDSLLLEEDVEHNWAVPGLLERQERLIVNARGGAGKSTLLRQIAVMGASGLHPFTEEPITPVRTVYIDLENRRRRIRQKMTTLSTVAGDRYQPNHVVMAMRDVGLRFDLEADIVWLTTLLAKVKPDLVIIGPLYKMGRGDPNGDEFAQPIIYTLDDLMGRFDFAIIIEAHPPYGAVGSKVMRPQGTAVWERWPDYGLYLDGQGKLIPYRPARGDGVWPTYLKHGITWPWVAVTDPRELLYDRIVAACRMVGEKMPAAALAQTLGVSAASVSRCIGKNGPFLAEWEHLEIVEEEIWLGE